MKHINLIQRRHLISKDSMSGFTLIELMVVLVVIAIMAAVAIPSYRGYVVRNAEKDVQAVMQNQAIKLKQWRAKRLNYKGYEIDDSDPPPTPIPNFIYIPRDSDSSSYYYKITLVDGGDTSKPLSDSTAQGQNWVMLAVPNPTGMFKNANTYFINSNGNRCYVDHTRTLTVSSNCTGALPW